MQVSSLADVLGRGAALTPDGAPRLDEPGETVVSHARAAGVRVAADGDASSPALVFGADSDRAIDIVLTNHRLIVAGADLATAEGPHSWRASCADLDQIAGWTLRPDGSGRTIIALRLVSADGARRVVELWPAATGPSIDEALATQVAQYWAHRDQSDGDEPDGAALLAAMVAAPGTQPHVDVASCGLPVRSLETPVPPLDSTADAATGTRAYIPPSLDDLRAHAAAVARPRAVGDRDGAGEVRDQNAPAAPEPWWRRPRVLAWGAAITVVVAVLAVGVALSARTLWGGSAQGSPSASVPSGTGGADPTAGASGPSTQGADSSASGPASPTAPRGHDIFGVTLPGTTAGDQARYLSEILEQSAAARSELIGALDTVRACDMANIGQAGAVISSVSQNRRDLIAVVTAADLSAIPDGETLLGSLLSALNSSLAADEAFEAWAAAVQVEGCDAGADSYQRGLDASRQAGESKEAFVAQWNSAIAPQFGLAEVSRDTI